jgi:hypothetical protein
MFWFDEDDDAALEAIREYYRCKTKSQALRLALGIALQTNGLTVRKKRKRKVKSVKAENFFDRALALSKEIQVTGLPNDYSERLDDYLYGHMTSL